MGNNARRRQKNRIKNAGEEVRGKARRNNQWAKYHTHVLADDEWEFCQAIEEYKDKYSTRFLSWCEVLEVVKLLGYKK